MELLHIIIITTLRLCSKYTFVVGEDSANVNVATIITTLSLAKKVPHYKQPKAPMRAP